MQSDVEFVEYVKGFHSKAEAARQLGLHVNTLKSRLLSAQARVAANRSTTPIALPPKIPSKVLPIDDLLGHRDQVYRLKAAHADASDWFNIQVKDSEPIGVVWMTDPHLDDDGCDWPQLRHDVELMARTPNVFAISGGDLSNNWIGRLARLWGHQSTDEATARRLVEWFLTEAGIRWLAVCHGNHDAWGDGAEIIKRMMAHTTIPVVNWRCRFSMTFTNGREVKISAAHNWKGHSWFHALHGPLKQALIGGNNEDVILAGHTHQFGVMRIERENGTIVNIGRARGYKRMDTYALVNGFAEGKHGCAIMIVIDPSRPKGHDVTIHSSIDEGVMILNALRAARKTAPKSKAKRPKPAKKKPAKRKARKGK